MFKRKIYDKLLAWKQESAGKTALLIEGARRIGKSTVVEEFAKNEYDSYIMIVLYGSHADYNRHVASDSGVGTGGWKNFKRGSRCKGRCGFQG